MAPVTSSWKPFLIRAFVALWGFVSHSNRYRIVLSCLIQCTRLCHFAMILKLLLKQSAFHTHGSFSVDIYGTELTSLVSVSFLLIAQKFLEKLGLAFLFVEQHPSSHRNVHELCTHRHFPCPPPPHLHFPRTEAWPVVTTKCRQQIYPSPPKVSLSLSLWSFVCIALFCSW